MSVQHSGVLQRNAKIMTVTVCEKHYTIFGLRQISPFADLAIHIVCQRNGRASNLADDTAFTCDTCDLSHHFSMTRKSKRK
jgi:hypothetical protein